MSSSDGPELGRDVAPAHYEVRVRGALRPVLLDYLCPADRADTFARHTFVRLYFSSALDVPEIVGLLAASNAEVLDLRPCRQWDR
ncbi:MAG: hypothetical protein JWO63_1902 [Frankiales bacterium]|jgi:hypothetical protein|nr:hypothetical protein [Frankiales bacterium]